MINNPQGFLKKIAEGILHYAFPLSNKIIGLLIAL